MIDETSFHDLVPVTSREIGRDTIPTVNARDLHETLDVGRDFSTWIKGRISQYGFEEGRDYVTAVFPNSGENLKGGRPSVEYHLTLDMAKEVAMVESNDRGRAVRRHFIGCEKLLRQMAPSEVAGGIDRTVIGGIVKSVVHKEIMDAIQVELPTMVAAEIAKDARRAVVEYTSVRKMLDDAKAHPKGRRSLNAIVRNRMRDICSVDGGAKRCPLTNVWLYPVAIGNKFMLDAGNALVAEHNDRVRGQGVFKLVPMPKKAERAV